MQTNLTQRRVWNLTGLGVAGAVMLAAAKPASAQAMQIYVDGQPLRTAVAPIQQNGRVLVPMRALFQRLGATVTYDPRDQSIRATRGTTTVDMTIGSNRALVNGQTVFLDAPANAINGRTMVPLRFVSESLGAEVSYNHYQRMVSVDSRDGRVAVNPRQPGRGGSQVGSYRQIAIPAETVVPVTLDQRLSSETAYVGQTFTATVVSQQAGDSEFPAGTRIEGVVNEVRRMANNQPGVLGLTFRTAVLPDGSRVNLQGQLISLENDAVSNVNGRLTATPQARSGDALKVIGIGAGAGYLIGRLLDQNGLISALIGAAGGYLYDRNRDRGNAREAVLEAGTRLGVRLTGPVYYRDTTNYYQRRSNFIRM